MYLERTAFSVLVSLQGFSVKGQRKNILGFAGHLVSVATSQLCCFRMKIAIEFKLVRVCVTV